MKNKKGNIIMIAVIIIIVAFTAGMIGWLLASKSNSSSQQLSVLQNADRKPVVNQQQNSSNFSATNQNKIDNTSNTSETELNIKKESVSVTLKKCGLVLKNMELVRTTNYNMFGEIIFDTVVCGYMVKKVEPVPFIEDGSTQTNAYFRVIEFADEKFKESIVGGVDEGNSVNSVSKDGYDFNLGCLEKGKIIGGHREEAFYINSETENKVLSSSENKPIALILSFGIHGGMGCDCCSLAHKIRAID